MANEIIRDMFDLDAEVTVVPESPSMQSTTTTVIKTTYAPAE